MLATSDRALPLARLVVWAPAVLMLLPLLGLVFLSFSGDEALKNEVWLHLSRTVLGRVSLNTIKLVSVVAVLSTALGVGLAWLVVQFSFPGRKFFSWVLALPLAIPSYVLAFVWIGSWDYSGEFATYLRNVFSFDITQYFAVRSFAGVSLVLSLSLFPYVFVLSRNAFESIGPCTLEVSRSLGASTLGSFFRVLLPASLPWVIAGTSLVVMETLADFGTVAVFNYDTFTTAIYQTWFGLHSIQGASQLALVHLVCVAIFLSVLSRLGRGERRFEERSLKQCDCKRLKLSAPGRMGLTVLFSLVFVVALAFPLVQLVHWSWSADFSVVWDGFFSNLVSSLSLGAITALCLCAAVLAMHYSKRFLGSVSIGRAAAFAKLGYAIPGTVIAVAVMLTLTKVFGPLGTSFALAFLGLLLGLSVRFFSVAYLPISNAFKRIPRSLDEVSSSLGTSGWETFKQVHMELLKRPLAAAAVLVFIDVIKEMPMTLMLRPFDWDTLAVKVYQFTAEGQWNEASPFALSIVLVALVPAAYFARRPQGVSA